MLMKVYPQCTFVKFSPANYEKWIKDPGVPGGFLLLGGAYSNIDRPRDTDAHRRAHEQNCAEQTLVFETT